MTLRNILRAESVTPTNILIVGSESAAEKALQRLDALRTGPVATCALPGPLRFPDPGCVALVLRSVGALNPEQQAELSRWLEENPQVPVVSLSSSSLYALVVAGKFSERLYYRLNMVVEEVDGQ